MDSLKLQELNLNMAVNQILNDLEAGIVTIENNSEVDED